MRTISKTHLNRLILEAEEAELLQKESVAIHLTKQIIKRASATREDEDNYTYDQDTFEEDMKELIWDMVVRVSDFYGTHVDSEKMESFVDDQFEKIVDDIKTVGNISSDAGMHEPTIPGEAREFPVLEVEEEV